MGLNANDAAGGGKTFEQMEAGTYPARLVMVVDLGIQAQRPWQGKEKDPAQEIALTYEFVDEFLKDEDGQELKDKPRWLTESMPFFNLGAEKAKSTQRYLAMDPSQACQGDWRQLLGVPVMVTVVLNPNAKKPGQFWENIAEVSPMRAKDADKCPPLVNEARQFDLDNPDLEVFLALPKFLQTKLRGALNFSGSKLEGMLEGAGPAKDTGNAAKPAPAVEAEDGDNPY